MAAKMRRLTEEAHANLLVAINSFRRALLSSSAVDVEEATRVAVNGAAVVKTEVKEEVAEAPEADVDMAEAVRPVSPSVDKWLEVSDSESEGRRRPPRSMPRSPLDVDDVDTITGGGSSGSAAAPEPPWGLPPRAERGLEPRKPWRKRGGQKHGDQYNRHMAALHREKGKGKGKGKGKF